MARFQDILDYHSSVEDAARTAARGRVGTLVLTHCVPPPAPGTEDEWIAEAAAHFDGEIILGPDLHRRITVLTVNPRVLDRRRAPTRRVAVRLSRVVRCDRGLGSWPSRGRRPARRVQQLRRFRRRDARRKPSRSRCS